jgi:hypothetical protein
MPCCQFGSRRAPSLATQEPSSWLLSVCFHTHLRALSFCKHTCTRVQAPESSAHAPVAAACPHLPSCTRTHARLLPGCVILQRIGTPVCGNTGDVALPLHARKCTCHAPYHPGYCLALLLFVVSEAGLKVPVLLAGVLTVSVLHTDIATPTAAAAALGFTQRLYLGCSSSHYFVSVSLGLAFFLPVVCGGGRVLAWCQCAGRCRDGVLAAVAAAVLACHAVPSVHPLYIWGV